jgi:hypothetical protein
MTNETPKECTCGGGSGNTVGGGGYCDMRLLIFVIT